MLQFLAGEIADCEYVVLCCHGGLGHTIDLRVIEQKDSDYDTPDGWEVVTFSLTPENIPDYVRGKGRVLICGACSAGTETLAQAFFTAGYKAYIASGAAVYGLAGILFEIGFFYHLMSVTRIDQALTNCTEQEAVMLAARMDAKDPRGTLPFRYFSPNQEK